MTYPDDAHAFKQAFNRLAVATRLPADQADKAMQRIYFEGLEDLSLEAVTLAAQEIGLKSSWFPKLAEWREAAKLHEQVIRLRSLPAPREEPWHHECPQCEDSGFVIKRCFPDHPQPCGVQRCKKKREHTYAVRCGCVETNRTYERNRAHLYRSIR